MKNNISKDSSLPEIISFFENKYPVETWCVKGVYVWPYIRIKLYITLLSQNIGFEVKSSQASVLSKNKRGSKFLYPFKLVVGLLKFQVFIKSLQSKSLIFVGSHDNRVLENGLCFNRFFDSMIKTHALENKVYVLEYQKVFPNTFNKNAVISLEKEIENYKIAYSLKRKFRFNRKSSLQLMQYDLFLSDLETLLGLNVSGLGFKREQVDKWVLKLLFLKGFFVSVFNKCKPQKLIFSGYYGWDNLYAAIYAANALGIKTIDYQHGPQTNHMVFSGWNKHPKEGYNLMPKEYWSWDGYSQKNIEIWAKDINVIAKQAGQSYLAYTKNKLDAKVEKSQVFFSLQGFNLKEMIPESLKSIITELPYVWIFRLHPRSDITEIDVIDYLKKINLDETKFMVQHSKEEPIVKSLQKAIVHVTSFSGCTIEATLLGVPTVVIHPEGKNMFKTYIENRDVFYVDKSEELFPDKLKAYIEHFKEKSYNIETLKVVNPLLF